ncbi:MAG: hypothetical protein Q9221_002080 [Calogaya cf. arnoldii]
MATYDRIEPRTASPQLSLAAESYDRANAPEVDCTVLAPEWRGDKIAPEMAPGSAMQVIVNNSPPEAIEVETSEKNSNPPSSDATVHPRSRKKRIALGIVLIGTILAALSIGLGIGLPLHQRHQKERQDDAANTTSADQESSKSLHSIMDDTAIAAVTLPNGNRQVFFQEESGKLRRALYSSQAGIWQTSTDPQMVQSSPLIEDAKNNTPLAAATWRNIENGNDIVSLFYVSRENNTLKCIDWELDGTGPCATWFPEITLAPDSPQISATWLMKNNSHRSCLLLIYQEPSQNLVVFRADRTLAGHTPSYTWFNETDRFNSALTKDRRTQYPVDDLPGPSLADSCIAVSLSDQNLSKRYFYLNCYFDQYVHVNSDNTRPPLLVNGSIAEFIFGIDSITGNITVYNSSILYSSSILFTTNSESALMPTEGYKLGEIAEIGATKMANRIWFMAPVPQSPMVYARPSPNAPFSFQRLSTTSPMNTTKTYLYHQINDSTVGEEYWDGTSGFWLSDNLTIDVSGH